MVSVLQMNFTLIRAKNNRTYTTSNFKSSRPWYKYIGMDCYGTREIGHSHELMEIVWHTDSIWKVFCTFVWCFIFAPTHNSQWVHLECSWTIFNILRVTLFLSVYALLFTVFNTRSNSDWKRDLYHNSTMLCIVWKHCVLIANFEWMETNKYWSVFGANWNGIKSQQTTSVSMHWIHMRCTSRSTNKQNRHADEIYLQRKTAWLY